MGRPTKMSSHMLPSYQTTSSFMDSLVPRPVTFSVARRKVAGLGTGLFYEYMAPDVGTYLRAGG